MIYTLVRKNWNKKIDAICSVNSVEKFADEFEYEGKYLGFPDASNGEGNLLDLLRGKLTEGGKLLYNKETGHAVLLQDSETDTWYEWTNKIEW